MQQNDNFLPDEIYPLWVKYLLDLDLFFEISEYHPDGNYIALYTIEDEWLVAILNLDNCVEHVKSLYYNRTCDNQFKVNFKHYILFKIKHYTVEENVKEDLSYYNPELWDKLKSRYLIEIA